jgi:polyisoprenyl-teichoic acid--peptidoglycan teichoic acid transferase
MKQRRTKKQPPQPSQVPDGPMPYEINRSIPNPAYISSASDQRRPDSAAPEPKRQRRSWKKVIKRSLLTVLLVLICAGGWVGWKFVSNEIKVFGWGGLWSLVHPAQLNNQGGRVNILLAGDSVGRTDGGGGQQLTDSIMIASIDMKNHTAFLLSVPRDLYVNIPGSGYSKINAAAEDGASDYANNPTYDANGIGLLEQVISQDFGITLDYYALVDYSAFESAVNAVGGITVNIQSSDPRGLYDASDISPGDDQPLVDLSNGVHELNGQEALDLARARGDAYGSYGYANSDFTRTQNQRMMLIAIKTKAATAGVLANPIKLGNLFDSFGDNVQTDLSLGNARELYNDTKSIPNAKIGSESLNSANGKDLLTSYLTDSGEDALVPAAGLNNYSQIQAFIAQLTDTTQ